MQPTGAASSVKSATDLHVAAGLRYVSLVKSATRRLEVYRPTERARCVALNKAYGR
jgi:hypothetical protein